VEHSPVPLIGLDESGMIAMANKHTLEIAGKPGGALMGNNYAQVLSGPVAATIDELRKSGSPEIREISIDGGEYFLHYVPISTVSLAGSCLLAFVARQAHTAMVEVKE
jgi:PAS domain-containing protein